MSENPSPLFKLDHESFRYLLWDQADHWAYWITENGPRRATQQEVKEVRHRTEKVEQAVDYLPREYWRWGNPELFRVLRDWDRKNPDPQ